MPDRTKVCADFRFRIGILSLVLVLGLFVSGSSVRAEDTLRIIRASLADRVQRIRSAVVKHRERIEFDLFNHARESEPEIRFEWGWNSSGNEFYHVLDMRSPREMGMKRDAGSLGNWEDSTSSNWAYGGERLLLFSTDQTDRMLHAQVIDKPPDLKRLEIPEAPMLLGLRVRWMADDLAKLAQHSKTRFRDSIDVEGRALPGFELTADGSSGMPITVTAAFDPDAGWLPVLLRSEISETQGNAGFQTTVTVTSSATVTEGVSDAGERLVVPKTAIRTVHSTTKGEEARLAMSIDAIQINSPISPALFAPEIPDGVIVDVVPSKKGGFPHTYVSGGKAIERQVLAARTAEIADERQRLLREHGPLDATPASSRRLRYWLVAIGLGLLLAAARGGRIRAWLASLFRRRT
jgi:hypothetical protein